MTGMDIIIAWRTCARLHNKVLFAGTILRNAGLSYGFPSGMSGLQFQGNHFCKGVVTNGFRFG